MERPTGVEGIGLVGFWGNPRGEVDRQRCLQKRDAFQVVSGESPRLRHGPRGGARQSPVWDREAEKIKEGN